MKSVIGCKIFYKKCESDQTARSYARTYDDVDMRLHPDIFLSIFSIR